MPDIRICELFFFFYCQRCLLCNVFPSNTFQSHKHPNESYRKLPDKCSLATRVKSTASCQYCRWIQLWILARNSIFQPVMKLNRHRARCSWSAQQFANNDWKVAKRNPNPSQGLFKIETQNVLLLPAVSWQFLSRSSANRNSIRVCVKFQLESLWREEVGWANDGWFNQANRA